MALAEHDERLHDLAAIDVGLPDDGALGDRGVLEQRALDLERADAVYGAEDHVVGAPDEPEVPVLVARRSIAREVPVVPEDRGRLLWGIPVADEERRRAAAEREVSLDAGGLTWPASSITATSWPGVGSPMDPGLMWTSGMFATRRVFSVWP